MPVTDHEGWAFLRAIAIQPEPVPISNTLTGDLRFEISNFKFETRSINSAVSGRGMRVAGVTSRSRPHHKVCPKIY